MVCRDHDGGDLQTPEDLEHLVPVSASVEPVFVLHHGDIELVQYVRAHHDRSLRSVDQLTGDTAVLRVSLIGVNDPYHADVCVVCDQSGRQRSGEGGQSACCRRERAENTEGAGALSRAFDGQIRDAQRCSSMRLGRGVEPARGAVGRGGHPAQAKRLSQGDETTSLPRRPVVRSVGPPVSSSCLGQPDRVARTRVLARPILMARFGLPTCGVGWNPHPGSQGLPAPCGKSGQPRWPGV